MTVEMNRQDGVAVVTVGCLEKLNALTSDTAAELLRIATELANDAEVRAVVPTGAGSKAFVGGADVAELSRLSPRRRACSRRSAIPS